MENSSHKSYKTLFDLIMTNLLSLAILDGTLNQSSTEYKTDNNEIGDKGAELICALETLNIHRVFLS